MQMPTVRLLLKFEIRRMLGFWPQFPLRAFIAWVELFATRRVLASSPGSQRSVDPRKRWLRIRHLERVPDEFCDPFRVKNHRHSIRGYRPDESGLNPRLLSFSPSG